MARPAEPVERPDRTILIQRFENALIAVAILVTVIVSGLPWWVLPAAFLAFDLSALGYLAGPRPGAVAYNLVHNYSAPALLAGGFAVLGFAQVEAAWLALLAASRGFHVAVDRALGYGLKLSGFADTHLGRIGRV